MAGSTGEEYGLESQSSSVEGMSSGQGYQTGDTLVEWRSSEQVENGTPSTSPPYWDTDDDDDFGPKPSDLYGKFTWKIENFSQITKRELRSNVFEVGGYKWYILIYPQGCDVCNHLSLFLCVANHDKLLPGWSHFAQFTIAVVNKDSKKSKYSGAYGQKFADTLHRFWKKEHDWGWKKFMELSKLSDGFIVADALVIKAQVQVIREKTHRPFRCLDCQYRRELVRVYLSNVEQLCRRYVEEKRGKFNKMIEDKVRWSSFRSFWLGVDQNARRWMSRDKTEAILKVVVKHFFIEKEVTSTLVMDSLYSGLKAIECQSKNNKGASKLLEMEEMTVPFVHVEKDMFVLTDDVLLLLERAALEPILPKDEKASQNQNQNRTKDSSSGEEFTKDSIERDERRLTELGRRTVEIFVLNHIFSSRIEVAYQEAVALKRQEELIREEEAAGLAENELKLKRSAAEKEKRTKKKQAKQKRNNRKGKERVRDEKTDTIAQEKGQEENISSERILEESSENQALSVPDNVADASDVSDGVDDVSETPQPDLDERDASPVSWDADTSESHPATETTISEMQNEQAEKKSSSVMDDSSSTCSTDSIPSVVMNGPYKRNALSSNKASSSPSRVKTQQSRNTRDRTGQAYGDTNKLQSDCTSDAGRLRDATINSKTTPPESKAIVLPSRDCSQRLEQHAIVKEEVVTLQKKAASKEQVEEDRPKPRITEQSSPASPIKSLSTLQQPKHTPENDVTAAEAVPIREPSSNNENQTEKSVSLLSRSPSNAKQEAKSVVSTKIATTHQVSAMSRPPSAPLIPAPKPMVPFVSSAQAVPLLSRSVSAAGRLGADTSPSTHSNVLQSYRNAIMNKATMSASTPNFAPRPSSSSTGPTAPAQSLPAFAPSPSATPLQKPARDHASARPGLTFGSVNPESLQTRRQWTDEPLQFESTSTIMHNPNLVCDMQRLDVSGTRPCSFYFDDATSMRQALGVAQDEFPHLDIINDLLDEEQSVSRLGSSEYHHLHHPTLNRQYTFPGDISTAADVGTSNGSCYFDRLGQYYDDGIPRLYGSTSGHFDLASNQLDLAAYVNGQLDGVNRSQWPMSSVDHSILGLGSAETNGYPYQLPDSSNMACGLNGYSMYRPANGL